MQKLSLEYYLCMTCYNANHCNYLTQVYQDSMTDYLTFFTLEGNYSSDPSKTEHWCFHCHQVHASCQ